MLLGLNVGRCLRCCHQPIQPLLVNHLSCQIITTAKDYYYYRLIEHDSIIRFVSLPLLARESIWFRTIYFNFEGVYYDNFDQSYFNYIMI